MNDIIKAIEAEQLKAEVPEFSVGDTVRVYGKIKEGNRERVQVFEGVVLKKQGGSNTDHQANCIDNPVSHAADKAGIGHDNQCGGNHNADDHIGHGGVILAQQIIHPLGQQDNGQQRADTAGDQHAEIKIADPLDKRRIQAQRHQQGGEAHTGRDYAQRQAEAAEQIPAKAGGNGDG